MKKPLGRTAMQAFVFGFGLVLICAISHGAEEQVYITEFMAANTRTLRDQNREYPDWIELHNPGATPINLDGWFLTDKADHLSQWRFPAVTLAPNGYLVVFASGKNRQNANGQLHTNFKLATDGEYLALVKPDGRTIASHFNPAFPQQIPDVSCGLDMADNRAVIVAADAPKRVTVPTGDLGGGWTQVNFDDSKWSSITGGLGFQSGTNFSPFLGGDARAAMFKRNASAVMRIPFSFTNRDIASVKLRIAYDDGFIAYLNGTEVARRNAPANARWNSAAEVTATDPALGGLTEDFESDNTSYTVEFSDSVTRPKASLPNTGSTGRFLRLINGRLPDQMNGISFSKGPAPPFDAVEAEFDFRCRSGGEGGDVFYFYWLPVSVYGVAGAGLSMETLRSAKDPSFPGVFAVRFRLYPPSDPSYVSLHWDRSRRAHSPLGQVELPQRVFHRARVRLRFVENGAFATVSFVPNVHQTNAEMVVVNETFIPGLLPFEGRVQFIGRTAGQDRTIDLDNIQLRFPAADAVPREEIDLVGALDLLRPGKNVLALQGFNRAADDSDFLLAPELVARRSQLRLASLRFFPTPTPRGLNNPGLNSVAPPPEIDLPGGVFTNAPRASLRARVAGGEIRMTFDGSEPNADSMLYTAPIEISRSVLLKAKLFVPGMVPSATVVETYTLVDESLAGFSSNLPLVIVNAFGSYITHGRKTPISLHLMDGDNRSELFGAGEFSGRGDINTRGYSSLRWPKRSYTMRIRDNAGDKRKVPVLGMPKESDWVLYAPYSDKTLIRDALAYRLSNEMGRWAPRTRFVELFIHGSNEKLTSRDYAGVYVLEERVNRDKNRVNIEELTGSDNSEPSITGGYLLKRDHSDRENPDFTTDRGCSFYCVEPERSEITPQQRAWLANYVNGFERALYGSRFADHESGYRKYLDVDAFIDQHWLIEFSKNIDGFRYSAFLHKTRGGKLIAGPAWDWNLSFGNADYHDGWESSGWYHEVLRETEICWFRRLDNDLEFMQATIDRWSALRSTVFAPSHVLGIVDEMAATLQEAQARNFKKWPILGREITPNWYVGRSYRDEISWMKQWIQKRFAWIDAQFPAPPRITEKDGAILTGGGKIYFTLDGTDPRAVGGGKSSSARDYTAPIRLRKGDSLIARVHQGRYWSGPVRSGK